MHPARPQLASLGGCRPSSAAQLSFEGQTHWIVSLTFSASLDSRNLRSNSIEVHVHHLRRKLLDSGATAEIHTVRGVGYLLTDVTS